MGWGEIVAIGLAIATMIGGVLAWLVTFAWGRVVSLADMTAATLERVALMVERHDVRLDFLERAT